MIEEALSSTTPNANDLRSPLGKTQVTGAGQATAKKSASGNIAEQPTERHKRLVSHLLIGFLMTTIAVAGYMFIGPHIHANAAEQTASHIINVATDAPTHIPQMSTLDSTSHMSEMAAIQVEMDAITNQMSMLKTGNLPVNTSATTGDSAVTNMSYNNVSGSDLDQALSTLDQMMLMTHEMINQMNSLSDQPGGMNTPADTSGHGHH